MNLDIITLTRAEQLVAKHEFFPGFKSIHEVPTEEIPLYEEVCGQRFNRYFGRVADVLQKSKENNTPFWLRGFPLGYLPRFRLFAMDYKLADGDLKEFSRLPEGYNHPYIILFSAVVSAMGLRSKDNTINLNIGDGEAIRKHPHNKWAIVQGLRGRVTPLTKPDGSTQTEHTGTGVPTRLYDASGAEINSDNPVTLVRGDMAGIPPHMLHSVDGHMRETFSTGPESFKIVKRYTAAIFTDTPAITYPAETLAGGEARFTRSVSRSK